MLASGGVACKLREFACEDDDACKDGDAAGTCEASGFCSFPDLECASGRRYGELVGDDLAGTCVELAGSSGSGDASSSAAVGSGSGGIDPATDPYGMCEVSSDCNDATAACVTNGMMRMCAPTCTTEGQPASECPPRGDGDTASIACLFTDASQTTLRCFIACTETLDCPAGMTCASPVCTWPG